MMKASGSFGAGVGGKAPGSDNERLIVGSGNRPSTTPTTTSIEPSKKEETQKARLVFGLSSKTNRSKHDEYAEQRSRQLDSINNNINLSQQVRDDINLSSRLFRQENQLKSEQTSRLKSPSTIRASKYGNFYKPAESSYFGHLPKQPPPSPLVGEEKLIDNKKKRDRNENEMPSSVTGSGLMKRPGRRKSPQRTPSSKTGEPRASSGSHSREQSPVRSENSRFKELDNSSNNNNNTTTNTNINTKVKMQFNIPPPPPVTSSVSRGSVVSYAKSRIYDKQLTKGSSSLRLNSIINNENGNSVLDQSNSNIPESILCGFKPPKQINVSKAREKWEGGEPFAKCKSRQRLAAQASGKKLLGGTWSMTSVVATQQLQLQQALAQSANGNYFNASEKVLSRGSVLERVQQFEKTPPTKFPSSSSSLSSSSSALSSSSSGASISSTDSSLSSSSSSSCSSSSSSSSTSLSSELAAKLSCGGVSCQIESDSNIAVSEVELSMNGGEIVVNKSRNKANLSLEIDDSTSKQPTSKQAIYKSKVSSAQSKQQQQQSDFFIKSPPPTLSLDSPINKPQSPLIADQRRLSFSAASGAGQRRRSSTTLSPLNSLNNNNNQSSQSSSIPKFYHPNGKPNTYEIELLKKNIVACFDKFPDRKALLSGPNSKRHFHAIALACNFSEYFKEPLIQYVKYKLLNSNLLHSPTITSGAGAGAGAAAAAASSSNANANGNIGFIMATTGNTNNRKQSFPTSSDQNNNSTLNNSKSSSSTTTTNPLILSKAASIDNSTMEKIQNQNYITCDQFLICWKDLINSAFDQVAQFIHLLTIGKRNFLLPDDFVILIQSIIDDHPGLKFLRAAPDFHMRYIQTVIARIYYHINKSWTGKINLIELRRSNLLAVLEVLSKEDDINQITDYFSYEHFYVIYCKFWSLDQDHDLLISKDDLSRHNDAAISSRIIDRIFMGIVSKQIQLTGKMSYSDFVWFLLAEEDKKHPRSIEYWFRLMDIDGDGYISMYEMEYFYYEQQKRLELMNIEALPFIDSACQILDLVNPKEKNKISLSDLKRTKLSTIFFDTFINLEKYLEHESREYVSSRDLIQDGVIISDWDRYAQEEYENLVTEETSV